MTLILFLFNFSSLFYLVRWTNFLLESEKAKNEKNLVKITTSFQHLGVSILEKWRLRRQDSSGLHVCVSCKERLVLHFRGITRTKEWKLLKREFTSLWKISTVHQNCNEVIMHRNFPCHLLREPKSICIAILQKPCMTWELN